MFDVSTTALDLGFDVTTVEAVTGAYASGHYEINPFPIFLGTEKTEFIAIATDPFPTAKGELEHHATAPGFTAELHADIDCLSIVDNEAVLSGPVRKYVVNGVPIAVDKILIRVEDHGEGKNSLMPDQGSQLTVLIPSLPQSCESHFPAPLYPNQNGNIQVREQEGGV